MFVITLEVRHIDEQGSHELLRVTDAATRTQDLPMALFRIAGDAGVALDSGDRS